MLDADDFLLFFLFHMLFPLPLLLLLTLILIFFGAAVDSATCGGIDDGGDCDVQYISYYHKVFSNCSSEKKRRVRY